MGISIYLYHLYLYLIMPVPYHLTLGLLYILYFHIYFRSSLAMHIQIKKTNSGILLADALTAEMN